MRVLISTKLPLEGFDFLMEKFEVVFPESDVFSKEEVIQIIPSFDAFISTFQFKVDKEVIDAGVSGQLKIIANYGVGYDNVDVEYAAKKGIVVTNTPDPVTEPTAEHTIGLMLAAARRISECDRKLRIPNGLKWGLLENLGQSLYGKTLGIIGMGRIGKAVARRALAMDMKIIYYQRNRLYPALEEQFKAEFIEQKTLLSESDVVTLHLPLNENTYHLMNEETLRLMKPTAILINTARGPIVDEKALLKALKNHWIAAAALDVFENEPDITSGLLELDNVVLSPHNGTATLEARNEMSKFAAQNIINFFEGNGNITKVN